MGVHGALWGCAPEAALVLAASMPSGDPQICRIRDELSSIVPFPNDPRSTILVMPTLRHVSGPFHSFPLPLLYIGHGHSDIQSRPSQWSNPYAFLNYSVDESMSLFRRYLLSRADLEEFLSPLSGAEMICDCSLGTRCHGRIIEGVFHETFIAGQEDEAIDLKIDAMDMATVMEGFDEDDEVGIIAEATDVEVQPAPKFNSALEAVNETVRSGAANVRQERPSWLPSWVTLIALIRAAIVPVFWEMFAGKAGLTREFLRQGWPCGPPVDIVYNPDFDLMNPSFLAIVLGLIFERLVRVLHLGPPCSSFSMACNRFARYAMRSAAEPGGFANLPPHRAEKVRLGNALAEIAARLAEAQEKAGNLWTLEQPATSLMWLWGPIAELIAKASTYLATIDVCMYGAPWRKPTTLAANFAQILRLVRKCDGSHSHLCLQGNAPCGRSWTAVASPYWPAFATSWVWYCCELILDVASGRRPPFHFAGMTSVDPSKPVEQILVDMGFEVPRGSDRSTVAVRVSSGVQPTGRCMPQLLPDGLGPEHHLTVAKAVTHPSARPPSLPKHVEKALEFQAHSSGYLIALRSTILGKLKVLASLCETENRVIANATHEYIRKVVEKRNVAFMREVTLICSGLDVNLFVDYVFGLPMLGWARHSPVMVQRSSEMPRAERPSPEEVATENAEVLKRAKPSYSRKLYELAWAKTKKEFESFSMVGPYHSLAQLPPGLPRLLNRFGILEMHGGATEESCRVIDDGKARGHNADSANTAAHRPADLDLLVAICRAVVMLFPREPLSGFPSDFKSAYRQVTSDPLQALDFVIASWDTDANRQVFFMAATQIFGSGNAPLNFTRYADFCCRALASLFAIPAVHCVDDVIDIEIQRFIASSFACWRAFAVLCGWDVPDEKSPPPSQFFRALGAMLDFRAHPDGPLLLRPAEDRVEALTKTLLSCLDQQRLSPSLAGKLYGKLMFMSSQYYGRLGRALLRAFSRRQHENRSLLNPQILAAIDFWVRNMRNLRPREVPVCLNEAPLFISYSDGEGETAGVGVALWFPNGSAIAGFMHLPEQVRQVWSRAATCGEHYDIFEIEAVGPALVLHNWGHLIPDGSLWLHFIDNDAALATLVKGSSSVLSGEVITAHTHSLISRSGLWPWFDRVASKDNPVDQLSRGKPEGPWELVDIEFPPDLLVELNAYIGS